MSSRPSLPDSASRERRQRLFFALWPDDAVRARLEELAIQAAQDNGRPVIARNQHITVVYIGPATAEMRDCLCAQVDAIRCPPFELHLDQVGYWSRPRVVWLASSEMPAALTSLYRDLSARLRSCGHQPETRPFRPHATLARKARRKPGMTVLDPVVWAVDRLCLVESLTEPAGVRYEVQKSWPLRAAP
jgi:2'-5' RNA ligase